MTHISIEKSASGSNAITLPQARRAAYFSIAGFCVMLATLSAGVFLHGRHGY